MLHKLQKLVVAVGTAAMLFGTMGAVGASAQTTATVLTRAQFVYDFAVANNLAPVYPSTPTFKDVPASSPYYGYIEAAYEAGWIIGVGNGDFAPTSPLTRAQVVKIEVIALGDGPAALADMNMQTTFTDNSTIPSWARGYVVEGVKIGLIKGYPNGTFEPNQSLTTADEPYFLAQYKAAESSAVFTIAAAPTTAAVGQAVTLSASGTTETVTYTVNSTNAAINGDVFIASAAGTYTITGMTSGGATATTTVTVYGAATGIKIKAPATVVANGASQTVVTVDIVDANGNVVANNSTDVITLSSSNNSAVGVEGSSGTAVAQGTTVSATAVDGVASFTLISGSVAGVTSTLTASDTTETFSPTTETASVSSVAQVATSLSVSAPKYIDANTPTAGTVTVTVNDQTGNPMLSGSGTFSISLALSGPANFCTTSGCTATATSPQTAAYTSGTAASFYFQSIQSETGAISFAATSPGLTGASGTTTAVIAGTPAALVVTATNATNSFTDGPAATTGNNVEFTVSSVDSHGYPTVTPTSVTVTVTANGTAAGTIGVSATATGTYTSAMSGTSVTLGTGGVFFLADTTTGAGHADAGTYSVVVSSAASNSPANLTAAPAFTVTETPGTASNIAVSPAAVQVGVASPNATVTAQITDANGNNVSDGGVSISFAGSSTYGAYTLGGVSSSTSSPYTATATATTNASGAASVAFAGQPDPGTYTITVTSSGLSADNTSVINIENTIATSLTVTLKDSSTGSASYATAGDTVTATVYAYNQYNEVVTTTQTQTITVTPSGTGLVCGTTVSGPAANGSYTVSCTAETAGSVTVTATDTSVAAQPSATASMTVAPGAVAGYELVTTSGVDVGDWTGGAAATTTNTTSNTGNATALAVGANTPVELFVKPIDAYGNATVLASAETLHFANNESPAGNFEVSNGGAVVPSAGVSLSAGTSEYAVWYVNSTAGSYLLNGDAY